MRTRQLTVSDVRVFMAVPVVSVSICWGLLPALVGLGVQQAVVSVDGMTQVGSVVLLTYEWTHKTHEQTEAQPFKYCFNILCASGCVTSTPTTQL